MQLTKNQAIEIDPKDALYHNNKGIANFNSNNFQEALECYNRAIEINPKNVIAYIGMCFNRIIIHIL